MQIGVRSAGMRATVGQLQQQRRINPIRRAYPACWEVACQPAAMR